jgi:thiol-disulfide isomerase/thioredoxin
MKKIVMICAAVAVLVVAGALYYLLATHGSGGAITGFDNQKVSAALMSQLYSIANNETLANRIGIGTAASSLPISVNGSALVSGGKPAVVYVGADFCPYCSITRWSLVIALMRFGNFTSLHYMTSSANDIYANTATFTFYNSSYSGAPLSFIAVEVMTNYDETLQTPNGIENETFGKYDLNNTEIPADSRGSIPFIDFANRSVLVGALVTPQAISGMDWSEIVDELHNSSSQAAQAIIGSANIFTADICASNASLRYSTVCNQSYIAKIRLLG